MRDPGPSCTFRSLATGLLHSLLYLPLLCTVLQSQQVSDTATLVGQLRVTRMGSPPMRVLVELERSGVQVGVTYSDGEGNFSFEDLPANLYHVVVRQEGYRPIELAVSINPAVQHIARVQLELIPEGKPGGLAQSTVGGSNPSMVDEAALADKYPKEARKHYEKAAKAQREGKRLEAIEHYEKALTIAPEMYFARNNLGSLYLEDQKFGEAETEFKKVIADNQADANAYFNLGNVYLITGRLIEAAGTIDEGLKRQPQSALGQFLMGSILIRKGDTREAEQRLREALNYDPSLANAHLALANLYLRQNRNENAAGELSLFLKQSPDSSFAPHARELLKRLQPQSSP
jgi:Tfp pilus assembly protein PilF